MEFLPQTKETGGKYVFHQTNRLLICHFIKPRLNRFNKHEQPQTKHFAKAVDRMITVTLRGIKSE